VRRHHFSTAFGFSVLALALAFGSRAALHA